MTRRSLVRNVALIAGLAVILLVFLGVTLLMRARANFLLGEMAREEGPEPLAREKYELAIRSRAPFNPYAKRAADRLEEMALRHEEKGETRAAIDAYEDLAGALSATRTGWGRSSRRRVEALERKIAALRQLLLTSDTLSRTPEVGIQKLDSGSTK